MFKFAKTLFFILLTLISTSMKIMSMSFECSICREEERSYSLIFEHSCGYKCCKNCIRTIIISGIDNREIPKCPNPECRLALTREDLDVLAIDADIIKKFEYLNLVPDPHSKLCPNFKCPYVFINEDVEVKIIQCPECNQKYCCQCLKMHNPKITCRKAKRLAEAEEEQKTEAADRSSKAWIEENSRPCPKCGTPLFKKGGCNKVTCSKCGTKIKWNFEKRS
jgi:hypothetical protein